MRNMIMFSSPNALKAIAAEFDVTAIVDTNGYVFERGDMHLKIATSQYYIVGYRRTKAVDAILSVKIDGASYATLSSFTALDMRDAVLAGIRNYHNFQNVLSGQFKQD